jgi:hypothetical protein
MATKTANYNLTKPDYSDNADIGVINGNMDMIDAALEAKLDKTDKYVHPGTGTNPHGTTKADVGLDMVDNIKQMPISGGVLENYGEKLITIAPGGDTVDLNLGNVFSHAPNDDVTYDFVGAVSGAACSLTLIIEQPETPVELSFPAGLKWQNGEAPDMSTAEKIYVATFLTIDGGTSWLGMFGGEF